MAIIQPQRKSISQVKAQLLNPATTSHFQVSVSFQNPRFNKFKSEIGLNLDQGRLNILCSDAALPGSRFLTAEINNNLPGVRERHVYRRSYDDQINLSFYCDADQYLPIRFFEAWMNFIAGTSVSENVASQKYSYRVKFPDQYHKDSSLEITKFEKNLDSRRKVRPLTYKFVNCVPLAINTMPVSYDASNLLKCTVGMAYSRYFIEKAPAGVITRFANALDRGLTRRRNVNQLVDETGLSRRDAAIIESGGFVETLIE